MSQNQCKIGTYKLLWNANRNSYAFYQMVLIPVTPKYPKTPHFRHFVLPVISRWWVEIETSNLLDTLTIASASLPMANHPCKGRGRVNHLNFGGYQPYPWNGLS